MPMLTEDQAWEMLGRTVPSGQPHGRGVPAGQEYSVKTTGAVHNAFGVQIGNPQGVDTLVSGVRREGGKFRVTPEHKLVLVWQPGDDASFMVVGQLSEPFRTVDDTARVVEFDRSTLKPGDAYPGPGDKKGGTFKISQRGGGLIEQRVRGGALFALTEGDGDGEGEQAQHDNARRVLAAWDSANRGYSKLFVNSLDDAWTGRARRPDLRSRARARWFRLAQKKTIEVRRTGRGRDRCSARRTQAHKRRRPRRCGLDLLAARARSIARPAPSRARRYRGQ